jgi:hypothetical protein
MEVGIHFPVWCVCSLFNVAFSLTEYSIEWGEYSIEWGDDK